MIPFAKETLEQLLADAVKIVKTSGEIILHQRKTPHQITFKGRKDLVTETDFAVEEYLKQHLNNLLPEADFLAEESADRAVPEGLTWIIDPVDGTMNFAHGNPVVGTCVALWDGENVVLGIINLPVLGECFYAVRGGGAFCNGVSIAVSGTATLDESVIAPGLPWITGEETEQVVEWTRRLLPRARGLRRIGSAAADLAWIACGRMEAYFTIGLKAWDVAAGWLILEEAGGRMGRLFSEEPYALGSFDMLASNGAIHDELYTLLR